MGLETKIKSLGVAQTKILEFSTGVKNGRDMQSATTFLLVTCGMSIS